jgi:hypothetical protein
VSSPDKLHRNDQAKSTRKRQQAGGSQVDDQRDDEQDVDASKNFAALAVNNVDKKANGVGRPPDPKEHADVMETFREVNSEPAKGEKTDEEKKANGVGKPPSAETMKPVMDDFREINGDVGRGKPPDPKQHADVMETFREVNAEPTKDKNGAAKTDDQKDAKKVGAGNDARLAGIVADLEGPAPDANAVKTDED